MSKDMDDSTVDSIFDDLIGSETFDTDAEGDNPLRLRDDIPDMPDGIRKMMESANAQGLKTGVVDMRDIDKYTPVEVEAMLEEVDDEALAGILRDAYMDKIITMLANGEQPEFSKRLNSPPPAHLHRLAKEALDAKRRFEKTKETMKATKEAVAQKVDGEDRDIETLLAIAGYIRHTETCDNCRSKFIVALDETPADTDDDDYTPFSYKYGND